MLVLFILLDCLDGFYCNLDDEGKHCAEASYLIIEDEHSAELFNGASKAVKSINPAEQWGVPSVTRTVSFKATPLMTQEHATTYTQVGLHTVSRFIL